MGLRTTELSRKYDQSNPSHFRAGSRFFQTKLTVSASPFYSSILYASFTHRLGCHQRRLIIKKGFLLICLEGKGEIGKKPRAARREDALAWENAVKATGTILSRDKAFKSPRERPRNSGMF